MTFDKNIVVWYFKFACQPWKCCVHVNTYTLLEHIQTQISRQKMHYCTYNKYAMMNKLIKHPSSYRSSVGCELEFVRANMLLLECRQRIGINNRNPICLY